ncbi:MAG TPA: hypothetical protein VLU43_00960 [Anaeromyxobacteraceae bacterium]|nr:hypothetical protein [Anaeromyxobacteraceae bacterium]
MKPAKPARAKVRSFSATDVDIAMLDAVARYHGFTKSATLVGLVRREFWRLFPAGTEAIRPARGARVKA